MYVKLNECFENLIALLFMWMSHSSQCSVSVGLMQLTHAAQMKFNSEYIYEYYYYLWNRHNYNLYYHLINSITDNINKLFNFSYFFGRVNNRFNSKLKMVATNQALTVDIKQSSLYYIHLMNNNDFSYTHGHNEHSLRRHPYDCGPSDWKRCPR